MYPDGCSQFHIDYAAGGYAERDQDEESKEAYLDAMAADLRSKEWRQDCLTHHHRVLTGEYAHWCHDWDGLPLDASCHEITCCECFPEDDKKLRKIKEGWRLQLHEQWKREELVKKSQE